MIAVAALNLAGFAAEFTTALAIESVALFADSIDFLEDASLNLLVALALAWSAAARARLGMALAALLLVPAAATLVTAWDKFVDPVPPAALPLTLVALAALVINLVCTLMLARVRHQGGSLSKAAFLSARNDVLANAAVIATGALTAASASGWPDLLVGLAIAALNAGAALEVWQAARRERQAAR